MAAGRSGRPHPPCIPPGSERQKRQESFSAFSQAEVVFKIQPRQVVGLRYPSLAGLPSDGNPVSKNEEVRDTTVRPLPGYCGAAPAVSVVLRRARQDRICPE